jgi:hypothetical protein
MNVELFAEYTSTVLLPHIARVRSDPKFTDGKAVLLLYHWSLHMREDILRTLAEHHVKGLTLPPHTINMFQCLDLNLFGVL